MHLTVNLHVQVSGRGILGVLPKGTQVSCKRPHKKQGCVAARTTVALSMRLRTWKYCAIPATRFCCPVGFSRKSSKMSLSSGAPIKAGAPSAFRPFEGTSSWACAPPPKRARPSARKMLSEGLVALYNRCSHGRFVWDGMARPRRCLTKVRAGLKEGDFGEARVLT